MMRNDIDRISKIMILILIVLMLTPVAYAIGVAPSIYTQNYKPGEKITYDLTIVNNGHEDLDVIIYPRGEFSDRVKISPQMTKMKSSEDVKHVTVELTMPEKIQTAGQHITEIVAVGSTPTPENEKAIVKADIAVISKLVIDVPYPEKYIEARLSALDTEVGKPAQLALAVFNKGSRTIENVHAKITIYNSNGTIEDEMTTESRSMPKKQETKYDITSTKPLAKGQYKAVATVSYDGASIEASTDYSVGELSIDIRNLVVNEFTLGEVAKFDILLYNTWNSPLSNVYAEMQVTGENNKEYANFKTVAVDVPANNIGVLQGYWYTQDVMPGTYYARITLHFANKVTQKDYELAVSTNKITAKPLVIGKAITTPEEVNMQNNGYLVFLMLGMAVIILVLVVKLKKNKKAEVAITAQEIPKAQEQQLPRQPESTSQSTEQKPEEAIK